MNRNRILRNLLRFLIISVGIVAGSVLSKQARLRARRDYFAGKVVVITGASRGIGRALAHAFTEAGAHLVLAARSKEQLLEVALECCEIRLGVETLTVPTDVTDPAQLQHLVDMAIRRFGRIDVLMNNAGIMQGGAVADMSPEAVRQHFEVNVLGTTYLTQLVLPLMLKQHTGNIVITASQAGEVAVPYFAAYSATKHALIGFGDSLRRELIGTGVKVTLIKSGFVNTDFISHSAKAWRHMGLPIFSPEYVAKRTLQGIQLGSAEVNIGVYETFGAWMNMLNPVLVDLWWRVLAPRDLPRIAAEQKTK